MKSKFLIKLRNWEYWPFGILQAPFFIYWFWLSLKSRSLLFFSASNPGILLGGMFGESKFEVQSKIPREYSPVTVLIKGTSTAAFVLAEIARNELHFPLIFKPDLGERGWMVRKINNPADAIEYLDMVKVDFIIQDFVDLPLEYGVFYVRYPTSDAGKVVSITGKEMLFVEGDGQSTLKELILAKDRARLQLDKLELLYKERLDEVLPRHERIELISIGNHCLGTKFLNANNLITEKLSHSFDHISKQIDGFYFGRFDLRVASIADLENGRVSILELNGCGAEPSHIYEPGSSIWQAIKTLYRHWNDIYRISSENHAQGVPYISLRDGHAAFKKFKSRTSGS